MARHCWIQRGRATAHKPLGRRRRPHAAHGGRKDGGACPRTRTAPAHRPSRANRHTTWHGATHKARCWMHKMTGGLVPPQRGQVPMRSVYAAPTAPKGPTRPCMRSPSWYARKLHPWQIRVTRHVLHHRRADERRALRELVGVAYAKHLGQRRHGDRRRTAASACVGKGRGRPRRRSRNTCTTTCASTSSRTDTRTCARGGGSASWAS